LNGQGGAARPAGVIFMGYRRTEESHYPISGELVDRTFIFVDLIHQDFKTVIHDLMHFFWIKFFGYGCIFGNIGKEDRHKLAFPFYGTPIGKYFVDQEPWGIGMRFVVFNGGSVS
jgi:hypothetical protein